MKLRNKALLKSIFTCKRNFSRGIVPSRKVVEGIEIAPFKDNAKAAACISADFELGWAWRGRSPEERDEKSRVERINIPHILRLLEQYDVPITWATVGHLFLERCNSCEKGVSHPDMPRPPRNDMWEGDWYVHDPCADLRRAPLWYAPDLISQIISSRVSHEIGTHSFSHIDFSPENSTRELIRREIEESAKVMSHFGIMPRSLVFPFNKGGYSYLALLSELGIIAVRHRDGRIRLSYPERSESGVYRIYESMNLRVPRYYEYPDKARLFIEEAVRRRAVYHLWFHPSDPMHVFENEFKSILEHICAERRRGVLWIATMEDLAGYCEARERTRLGVLKNGKEISILIESDIDINKYGAAEVSLIIPSACMPDTAFLRYENHVDALDARKMFIDKSGSGLVLNAPVSAKKIVLNFK